ncbi:MAG: hypothetical protein JXB49_35445 [Bacteroidales bacterium]|nr:hypothetical protein [Bacteroidales bacterium]
MKKLTSIAFLIIISNLVNAQNYDLIVTNDGDSIACHIDSITDTRIHFEMMVHWKWMSTSIKTEKVMGYEYDTIDTKCVVFVPGSSKIDYFISEEMYNDLEDSHGHHYIFAPNAFAIEKKSLYYNNIFYMIHEWKYGINDHFSLTAGTFIIPAIYYAIPQYSFPINDKSAFAIGDLAGGYPFKSQFLGNLAYGIYTHGTKMNNFSVGGGLFSSYLNDDIVITAHRPAVTFSAQARTSDYSFFVTENYFFQLNTRSEARKLPPQNPEVIEQFSKLSSVAFGITGFRFIKKKNPRASWSVCALWWFIHDHYDIPEEYNNSGWEVYTGDPDFFFGMPIFSYSRKLR